ncbi:hypothetical protein FA13DRAFT_1734641 [Coprinellus micaceus]|uniref:Uncharacterized protein n=1 Tax=Coprinellus micaceus TaxID=71717 RepID=A0A4Y7T7D0_COPMI|nr:hypothetical protein FA13DRAFT_1734641 [Coprinellus micaceus]
MLVTLGVALTTLSAQRPGSKTSSTSDVRTYASGIGLLTLALILSGFLGLLQEWTYKTYGKPSAPSGAGNEPTWKESMFYLHLLGLPMFIPLWRDIVSQIAVINYASPRATTLVPLPLLSSSLTAFFPSLSSTTPPVPPPFSLPSLEHLIPPTFRNNSFVSATTIANPSATSTVFSPKEIVTLNLSLPKAYLPLLVNTLTQLLCVSGVHRLTTRVSNLTVTLILVVRKAVSLVISLKGPILARQASEILGVQRLLEKSTEAAWAWVVAGEVIKAALGVDEDAARTRVPQQVDEGTMWLGAGLVLLGTVGYTIGTGFAKAKSKAKTE